MRSIRCWQIDAFTDRPFRGNPAAVCWLEEEAPDAWMQAVAAEIKVSETAFVRRCGLGPEYHLRWFSPEVEVPLCGHATLASAVALWDSQIQPPGDPIVFRTRSGLLTCRRQHEWVEMEFPATLAQQVEPPEPLLQALGVAADHVGRTPFDYLVVVDRAEVVRALVPDMSLIRNIPTRGVIVTSCSDDDRFDFVSRFFCPALGIPEDPVTGSAHCCLGPYWAHRLGKEKLTGYQASARGGVVKVQVLDNGVILGGQAVPVWRGELLTAP